ncbi:MAG: DUF2314 domain-containing protein [Phycisphaeraceae bacterium]
MIPFLNKSLDMMGSVLFRGTMQPRVEEFLSLKDRGFEVTDQQRGEGGGWLLNLRHPKMGEVSVISLKDPMMPPPFLIGLDPWLSPREKEDALACGSMVSVRMKGRKKNVLKDRKSLLRMLAALMGREGVVCLDHLAERFWSRTELRDELSHPADLDIGCLYTTHMVAAEGDFAEDEDVPIAWYHTHGLEALGIWDFDILAPGEPHHPGFFDHGRVLAFNMLAGRVKPGASCLITSKGAVALIDCKQFQSKAAGKWTQLRDDDEDHRGKRVVLCEPGGKLSRLMGRGIEPSRWLRRPVDETAMHYFTDEASLLMADRARKTFDHFRKIEEETRELERMVIVKIRYAVDGSDPADPGYEHMWHEVHALGDGSIDATLMNQPHSVTGVNAGDRRTHGTDDLSDWSIMSPLGMITPRYQTPLRLFRENKDEILTMLAEARERGEL